MGDFETFLRLRRRKLAMIASHTKGEHSLGDVQSEAYFMALSLEARLGRPLDWSSDTDQSLLIAYLYQKLVRWTETTVRFAMRIDQEMDDAEGDSVHPVVVEMESIGVDPTPTGP